MTTQPAQSAEQMSYARWLERATLAGLALLAAAFLAYATGWIPPLLPLSRLPEFWGLPAEEFLRATGLRPGWSWVGQLWHGDIANLPGVAMLAAGSLFSLIAVLPVYASRGDRVYVAICSAEILVLLLAASGLLGVVR